MDISKNIIDIYKFKVKSFYQSKLRLEQMRMSLDIADFLYNSNKQVMFVEAPVGTGKTLGTLIPVLNYAENKNCRITYATATKSLQTQVFNDDLSDIRKMGLLSNSKIVLAMGKDNYACIENLIESKDKLKSETRFSKIVESFERSATGLRSDIDEHLKKSLNEKEWNLIKITPEQPRCKNPACVGHRYREEFRKDPFITVTNHNQLVQSKINLDNANKGIMSVYPGVIVIDEAHLFDENFLSSMQVPVNPKDIFSFAKNKKSSKLLRSEIANLKKELNRIKKQKYGNRGRRPLKSKIQTVLKNIQDELHKIETINVEKNGQSKFDNKLSATLDHIHNLLDNSNYVSWISVDNQLKFYYLSKDFFNQFYKLIRELASRNKIIFLSGTLTTTSKPEHEISITWGLDLDNFEYKKYTSPFNLSNQVYLFLPKRGFFVKRAKTHQDEEKGTQRRAREITKKALKPLCNQVPGGMLVLCNSLEMKDKIYQEAKEHIKNRDLFKQGMMPISKISKLFKKEKSSILIGSGSFKSGFSVPGTALQSVIITALPFPVKDDPFMELKIKEQRKKEPYKSSFDISLEIMLKDLEQSIGRLIRKEDDFGVACVTDSRLYHKMYGKKVIGWLKAKGYIIYNDMNKVTKFMNNAPKKIANNIAKSEKAMTLDQLKDIPMIHYSERQIRKNHSLKRKFKIRTSPKVGHKNG